MFEIGNSLREARLRQGLEFPEIEQATKIRGKYLRALEEESFDVLPAQTYVKGFLRSYADYLGLDGQLYVDEFNSRYVRGELEDEEEQRPYRPRVSSPSRGGAFQNKAVLLTVAVIVVLTVFVFAAFRWGGSGQAARSAPAHQARRRRRRPRRSRWRSSSRQASTAAPTSPSTAGARTGRPIYEGTLENGKRQRFVGRHLWVYVFAPANLRLKLNGRVRPVPGAGTGSRRWLEVTPTRVRLAPPA